MTTSKTYFFTIIRLAVGIPMALLSAFGFTQGLLWTGISALVCALYVTLKPEFVAAKARISYWEILAVLVIIQALLTFRDLQ